MRALLAVGLSVVLAVAGIGGYVSGLFGGLLPAVYPLADPYTLIVEKAPQGETQAVGFMPSETSRDALASLVGDADLTLASGDIAESWGEDVLASLQPLSALNEWRFVVSNNKAKLSGITTDVDVLTQINKVFKSGLPGALEGNVDITFMPPVLPVADVRDILLAKSDCGLLNAPQVGSISGYG